MSDRNYEGIAIIGMAGRFPGADSIEEFWANLVAGKESISFFSDAELAESGLDVSSLGKHGLYVPARGILKDADCFDAAFFGIHPKEAEVMDPQQRLFLEASWHALERAGYAPDQIRGSVGIFAGATFNTYFLHALQPRPDLIQLVGHEQVMFGNEKDYITTRVAYKLGLKGPAISISTACSSSLVAVCQACHSLLMFQCDVALAGGVSVTVPQKRGYYYDEGNIGSSDGHTRSFDQQAAGTVFSNGLGVVVLKRLEDAVNDGDQIYAVIKGAALNNDGSQRVSFGAPGVEGQSDVIAMAHALAGIDPETITYVEAHGTATPLGDPIEVAALTKAFRLATHARQFCGLGSVKTNIGHIDAAAGAAGLIKTALALHHKRIPASLHFTKPNPKLDLENSPFYVNSALQEWKTPPGVPRRAGVSSFGTGGTNAHVVVEEAPALEASGSSRPWQLLVLSAKTPGALDVATGNLVEYLKNSPSPDGGAGSASSALADAAFTLQTGRSGFIHRRIVVGANAAEAAALLDTLDAKRVFTHRQQLQQPPVVFMFPGQGAQYVKMGAELYRTEPRFRVEVDECSELLKPILGADLREVMFSPNTPAEEAEQQLAQTRFTQPALFVIEYALANLWMSWGVKPAAMIGHSVGEYVAGCLSGVFTRDDALTLVARRAELVQALPGGSMLAVRLPEKEVIPLLDSELAIAALNSPGACVVSGPHEAVAALQRRLDSKGITARRLNTSHAFHSPMMEPVLAPFTRLLQQVKLAPPQIPYVSNVTAKWITPQEAMDPAYWAAHVRQTVRFAEGLAELMKDPRRVLLEAGPGQTLTSLARQHPDKPADALVLSSLPPAKDPEHRGILESLGRLWMADVDVDWQGFYANERRRSVVLPTYPFERKRYWPDAIPADVPATTPLARIVPAVTAEAAPPPAVPEPIRVTATPAVVQPAVSRKERLLAEARSLVQDLSGVSLDGVDPAVSFMELGLDSLLLTQAAQLFRRKFGVAITFRQLMEDLDSLSTLVTHLDSTLPPEAFAPVATVQVREQVSLPAISSAGSSTIEQILQQQLQLTTELLRLMGKQPPALAPGPARPSLPALATPVPSTTATAEPEQKAHGPFKPIQRGTGAGLSAHQQKHLDSLIARYTRRTARSKQVTQENRAVLADPRTVAGFKQLWKEMLYPIVTTRSDGSKVWDVDGNEYVDFVNGFGANWFGHRPPFLVEAIKQQLDRGFELGPIQPLAGEVAALVRELTGMERVAFCSTGSEAVMAAIRVARTVSGRDKIVVFTGAYHGIFDEVLLRPMTVNGVAGAAPIAPGIPQGAVDNVIVLEYGSPKSLEILRSRMQEVAAVLVEPVQSRNLDLQPKEFLQELRRITKEADTALVFDEVVTGFRVCPGGAQEYFGIRADLATYGKIVGGGLPIGLVTGKAKYLDALDGGHWQYGDASFPEVGVTFFAGTNVRHPLALAAAKAVMVHLKESGPELQERMTERTTRLVQQLREVLAESQAPFHLSHFSSLFFLTFPPEWKFGGLLFYYLRDRGIHIYENRTFVVTTAHSDEDLAKLVSAFEESLSEMRTGDFLPNAAESAAKPPVPEGRQASGTGGSPAFSAPSEPRRPRAVADLAAAPFGSESEEPFPLTDAQKEIWLAAQMGGNSAVAYNESLRLHFSGPFDVETFRSAVELAVERHPILLASISTDGQQQRVRAAKIEVPLIDLSGLSPEEQDRKLAAIGEADVSEAFDLVSGPLLRVKIVRLSKDRHVAVWTAHHIVCDGWSSDLLMSELAAIYSARVQGGQPALDTPVPFRGYALQQESDAQSEAMRDSVKYWQQQFVELPQPLDLPTDRPRPPIRSSGASTVRRSFDETLHQAIRGMAGRQRTTMVVMLMAALKTLLHRLSGQTDLVIGLGVAGQATTGKTCMVGHCINLLPVRTRLDANASFSENLTAVKKSVLDAYDHQECTVGKILQTLSLPRSSNRPPLVEVIFNIDQDFGAAKFHELEFSVERNSKKALHYDLFFNFVEGRHSLAVECDFNTDLFDATTLERWLKHYETLLEGIAANPQQKESDLPLLTAEERNQLLVEWNEPVLTGREVANVSSAGGIPADGGAALHEIMEAQVAKTPDAIALVFENQRITYDELNARANGLARYLREEGVGPEVLVAVSMDRSVDLVVSLLAILKAGGAYLPIDLAYPKDRLAFMLEDAEAKLMLTRTSRLADLPETRAKVICVDDPAVQARCQKNRENLSRTATPDNLAYVIYTSGSTGKPKGCMVTHRNVARLMRSTEQWFGFNERDVWTLFHSYAFDFSVWEMWGAWLYGGRLVIVPYLVSRSPQEFYELLVSEGVTVLNQTPSAFRQLIQTEESAGTGNLALRYVIFGGEALELQTLKPWFERHGDRQPQLVNMYGITETTVHVTYRALSKADLQSGSVIGVPIPDLQVYILDSNEEPVPIGVRGEMFVGGAGLARGYLKRPELTEERFIPNRFRRVAGSRLYKTGDLARYMPDGDIEYLGRIDDQVKIRGFRIELDEIKSVLCQHPAVRDAAVMVREDVPGNKQLLAYLEVTAAAKPEVGAVRDHVKKQLPDYMVPSTVVFLDKLPLTSNGKIDRQALQRIEHPDEPQGDAYAPPRDTLEMQLVQLWSKILGRRSVGIHDNFFDLGGHSLLAVRMVIEIEKLYGKRLPLATLLQAPTVDELASVLRKDDCKASWSSLVPIRPGGSKPPLFLMHSHGGNVLEYYGLANHLEGDQPVYALQARGLDGKIPTQQTIEGMAATYLEELKNLQPKGPYFLGGFCFGGLLALEAAQQLGAAGEEVALVVLIQTIHPAVNRFKPDISMFQRWWLRMQKRIDLERENMSHRRKGYLLERCRRLIEIGVARGEIALNRLRRNGDTGAELHNVPYILENLSIEHDKAYFKYEPRPYSGDVVLLRASKQLRGSMGDTWLGWKGVINGNLEVHEVPGHQQNILLEPNVSRLAAEIEAQLKNAGR